MEDWVKELIEDVFGPPLAIGDVVRHPSGRQVKIIDGQFYGTHGVSNFWHWREVLPDGTLSDTLEHGYGWSPEIEIGFG